MLKEMFVGTCGLVMGTASQAFIQVPVLGFLIGNFIGSAMGAFAYNAGYSTAMSFCVDTGFTMFGLVDQNYELPEDVLKEIGLDIFEYEEFDYERFEHEKFEFSRFEAERFDADVMDITFLRRGVIGVSQVGYT